MYEQKKRGKIKYDFFKECVNKSFGKCNFLLS